MIDLNEQELIEQERRWLVQWCTYLTGTPDEADDVAHDTMLVALRHSHKLLDPAGRRAWLAVIARYVALRWRRNRGREGARSGVLPLDEAAAYDLPLSKRVEQRELHDTLQQALRRVPDATRQMLVAHYVEQASYRTIAERAGVSEDAVAMRLSRARRQLRQILATDFADVLQVYRPEWIAADGWSATGVWCGVCGAHRLLVRLPPHARTVAFRCPGCHPQRSAMGAAYPLSNRAFARLLGAVRRPEVLLARSAVWAHAYFHEALIAGRAACTHCQREVRLQTASCGQTAPQEPPDLLLHCQACGTTVSSSVQGFLQSLPEVQAFRARQTRIRTVPGTRIEIEGVEAQVTAFTSMTGAAVLEVIAPRRARDLHHPITVVAGTRSV